MRVDRLMAMAAVGLCVAAFAGGAWAQEEAAEAAPRPERPARPDVMSWDVNGDGKVSFEEFKAGSEVQLKARFAALDADKDGSVTPEEFQRGRRERGERMRRRHGDAEGAPRPEATAKEGGKLE